MATSTRVKSLGEGHELLSVLSQYLKNPKLIAELGEEVVKLNTLTDEKAEELHQAQILVQQRDKLIKEIDDQRKQFAIDNAKQAADVARVQKEIDDYVSSETNKIDKAHDDLDKREAELNEYGARLDLRENQLKEKAAVAKALFKE